MKRFTIVLKFWILSIPVYAQCDNQNYWVGDTLYVAPSKGLILTETPEEKSKALHKMDAGESLTITDVFNYTLNIDTIDGFCGSWIKVNSVSTHIEGYVFDAFITRYPILKDEDVKNKIQSSSSSEGVTYLPDILLREYTFRTFDSTGCKLNYYDSATGEGAHNMTVTGLEGSNQFIEHNFWEGSGIELMLSKARHSEIYFLVLHLLSFLPDSLYQLNDYALKNCFNSALNYDYRNWPVKDNNGRCLITILCKGDSKSINLDIGLGFGLR